MSLYIPDTNQWHRIEGYRGPVILRAAYNNTPDSSFSADVTIAEQQPWWGAYQYLSAGFDPAQAATALLRILDGHRPNVTILDLEEGDGDQGARQHAWLEVMAGDPAADWTYSGAYFARAHGLTVQWIAAYQNQAPTDAHELWQFSDAYQFPGMSAPCDASVFDGTLDQLITLTNPQPQPEDDMALLVKGDASADWFVTDLIYKRHVASQDEANLCIVSGAKHDANNQPFVFPQSFVDGLKLVTP